MARRCIALIEILGSSWSLSVIVRLLLHSPGIVVPWSYILMLLLAFGWVGAAGVLLLRDKPLGVVMSVIAQGLQIVQANVGSIAFTFLACCQATVFFGEGVSFFAGFTASLRFS